MLSVDLLETTLNLQQNRAFIITFSATQTDFTWYVSYHQIVALSPINVLDSALFKIGTTTDVATFFVHGDLLRVQGSSNLGSFGI
jgi:hypothetical protein